MLRTLFRQGVVGKLVLVMAGFLAMMAVSPLASSAQDATPVDPALGTREQIGSQTVELDGKNRIWQVNRVTAFPQGEAADVFKVREGFVFAHQIPITVTIDGDDPVELAVGEAIAVSNKDQVTAFATDGTLGSYYTIELIDPLDIDTDVNRQVVGAPFETTGDSYEMDLILFTASPGVATPLDPLDLPGLVLVLDGTLIHAREDRTTTSLVAGNAGSGTGSGSAVAGEAGASFLVATITRPDE